MVTFFEYSPALPRGNQPVESQLRIDAARSFNQAYNRGKISQLLSRLLRRSNQLSSLNRQPVGSPRHTGRIVAVPIRHIKGSLGRASGFDAAFHPLSESSRTRWVSILTALRMGHTLPAVELLQVGPAYYVVDGHHRISVLKFLGQQAVDAHIVS